MNFSKRAGWIRLWWVVTISVTGWMIWVGQQESFDDRKLRSFKVQAAVVADIENPECGWLLIPARYVDDPAFSKQTSAMIGRAIANKSSDGALHGSCMQLNSFKIVLENRIFNRDLGLLPDFFVRDLPTYTEYMNQLALYGQRTFDRYVLMVYAKPVMVFVSSWALFLVLLMLARWIAAGFRQPS